MQPHDMGDQRLGTPLGEKIIKLPQTCTSTNHMTAQESTRGEIAFKKPYYSWAVSGGSRL